MNLPENNLSFLLASVRDHSFGATKYIRLDSFNRVRYQIINPEEKHGEPVPELPESIEYVHPACLLPQYAE